MFMREYLFINLYFISSNLTTVSAILYPPIINSIIELGFLDLKFLDP